MKNLVRVLIAATVMTLTATGCTVYHPQAVDIPLINHRGDARIDLSLGMSTFIIPDAVCANVTASYGFNDWLAGQVHFNFGGDNYYAQMAPGVYLPLGEKSVFETYLGVGYGGASREDAQAEDDNGSSTRTDFNGHYTLPFVQANIGWHDLTKLHVDMAVGLKAGAFIPDYTYTRYASDGTVSKREDYNTTNLLLEPQALLRVGSERLKLNFKVEFAFMDDIRNSGNSMFYDLMTVSTGLTYCF